ncbi:hypothetical protein PR202_ga01771 [Eleusine coracana subsp. coracana]|uniref:Major facilitator superfamily (MFS) profile domain-containing protein n=1 Tax=Eleusine coracana subsp. coracana TaxID=191504 RepID=A0AAV5BJZ8_ELECO|nr:hypothetical protein QOZ80_2AG0134900 [Eleusine coracana subsp. coracana]GJM85330.1 hypothetical protein PR202_ga01084 [Eleusine coracana subsp. coracana]GJM85958.1 hypothetical protein PR202_ga01771 [Eleusine coracana subsp. coracana]
MAGGVLAVGDDRSGGITFVVVMSCLTAASGGLLFGYDVGITGGLTQMQSFLQAFFPDVLEKMNRAQQDAYCIFNSQILTMFVSSFYLAAMLASLVAGHLTRTVGRRNSMLIGGLLFLAGSLLNFAAVNISMLVIGRILLGVAVGFTSLSAPVYLAEIAPTRWRGAFTASFNFFQNVGFLIADLTNYGATTIPRWGWRLSLGVGVVPSAVIVVGSLLISDTPSSLVLRGRPDEARAALRQIRGAHHHDVDVDAELKDIARAAEQGRAHASGGLRRLLRRREYRPHLAVSVAMSVLVELTGVVVVSLFTPLLFYTVGFASRRAILGSIITDVVCLASVAAAALAVDRVGRRYLLVLGGVVMALSLVATAWIFGAELGADGGKAMPRGCAAAVVALVCVYVAGFCVSWGPVSVVVTSEVFPLEVRPAVLGLGGAISGALTFAQSQAFLPMLCGIKYGAFAFYAGWVVVMTAFVAVFLPESKGVPIEAMAAVWERHWYWKRFVRPAATAQQKDDGPA